MAIAHMAYADVVFKLSNNRKTTKAFRIADAAGLIDHELYDEFDSMKAP